MGQPAPLHPPPVPRPRTNQHYETGSTAAHCLPLRSRGFHIPPIRQVVRQTPTILSRKPTRKPHHHGKPPFRVGYPPDHADNRENCFIAAIGGERRFPFRSSPQGMNPFPQSPTRCGMEHSEGEQFTPPPYRRTSLPRFQHVRRCLTTPFPS